MFSDDYFDNFTEPRPTFAPPHWMFPMGGGFRGGFAGGLPIMGGMVPGGMPNIGPIAPIAPVNTDRPDSPAAGNSAPTRIRKLFPESWLWSNVTAL